MTETIEVLANHLSPGGRPQPLAFHAGTLWLGCWDTKRLYAIDPNPWSVREEVQLPGLPYGIASFDGALRIVVSIGEADDRYIYRFVPGQSFGEEGRIECPEFTGSHITSDGKALFLVQQTNRRILELRGDGSLIREVPLTTRCAGLGFKAQTLHIIAADADFDVLEFATLDLSGDTAEPEKLAPMHAEARGLAFDGTSWWTSYREENDVVSFNVRGGASGVK